MGDCAVACAVNMYRVQLFFAILLGFSVVLINNLWFLSFNFKVRA